MYFFFISGQQNETERTTAKLAELTVILRKKRLSISYNKISTCFVIEKK